MKKIAIAAIITSIAFAGTADAATSGPYAGAGLGVGSLATTSAPANSAGTLYQTNNKDGLAGRVFAGYNFNRYFGLEAGYAKYADSSYSKATSFNPNSLNPQRYSLQAVDVVGKAYLPIGVTDFTIYALGGVAEVKSTVNYDTTQPTTSHTTKKLRPKFGVGAEYNVTSHFTVGMEASRIQGTSNLGTNSHGVPNAEMVTVNFTYNFD